MQFDQPINKLSRRQMLALLGTGAMSVLAGCQAANHPVMSTLPDADLHDSVPMSMPALTGAAHPSTAPIPVQNKQAVVLAAGPAGIIRRSVWTNAGPISWKLKPLAGVERITFHHSGDREAFYGNTVIETIDHLEAVRKGHLFRNFADIGYHFAIDRTGCVWQLRSMRYQGEHVRGVNTHNLGIVVLGNFELQSMTPQQKQRVITFGSYVRHLYGLSLDQVHTHREIYLPPYPTVCPGKNMQPFMMDIRRKGLI